MHIAVCDDSTEELACISALLEEYESRAEGRITYKTFSNATELLSCMETEGFDLFILDILMPGVTGMDAAREVRRSDSLIPIVFLTSSRDFGVESYRVNAEDYIMKPAGKNDIFPVLDRLLMRLSREEANIILKTHDGLLRIPLSCIVYVEVMNRILYFTLVGGAVRKVKGYLAEYETKLLSDSAFYKPHRSYVVNFRQVTELGRNGFETTAGKTVPVARDGVSRAKAAYMKFLLSND